MLTVNQLKDFSTQQLEEEIERRKMKKPVCNEDANWRPVFISVKHIVDSIEKSGVPPHEYEEWLFDIVMDAVYGEGAWKEWWNSKMGKR